MEKLRRRTGAVTKSPSRAVAPNATGNSAPSSATARGTIQLLAGRAFFLGSGYVITVVLARQLGPAAYGTYGLIMSLLLWLEGVGGLGVPRATMALLPGSRDPALVAQAARIVLVAFSLILFALCWLSAPQVARFFAIADGERLFRVAILDVPFYGLYLAYHGILQGRREFGTFSASLILYSIAKVLGVLALLWIGFSVGAALIVNVLATVAALVYLIGKDTPRILLPERALVRRMLALALPLSVFDLSFQLLLSGHLWLLKRVSDASDTVIGYYVAALNIARLPTIVTTVLSGVLLASISAALARNDEGLALRYLQSGSRFVLVVVFPACVLGALHAEELMALVYSGTYGGSVAFFRLLLLGFGAMTLLSTMFNGLMAAGRHYQITVVVLLLLPLLTVLSVLLTSRLGPIGTAWAFLATLACGTVVALFSAFRRFGAPLRAWTALRVAVATAVTAGLGQLVTAAGIWVLVELCGLLGLYLVLLVLMRELRKEDLTPFAVWRSN